MKVTNKRHIDLLTNSDDLKRIRLELFDTKWRLNHLEGKVNVNEMISELEQIENLDKAGEK